MAKSTRHSKKKREPVTIDLEAESVEPSTQDAHKGELASEGADKGVENEAATVENGPQPEEPSSSESDSASVETQDQSPTGAGEAAGDDVFMAQTSHGEELDHRTGETSSGVPPARKASRGGLGLALLGGVTGAALALATAGALQWYGILPLAGETGEDPALLELQQDLAALRGEVAQLRQVEPQGLSAEELEQALAEPRQEIGELRDMVTAMRSATPGEVSAEVDSLAERISETESRLSSLVEMAQAAESGDFGERLAGLESSLNELAGTVEEVSQMARAVQQSMESDASRLDEFAERVTQLDERVAQLDEEMERQDEGPRLALIVAASALKTAVERGAPFSGELETYTALTPDKAAIEPLRPYAETGIPTQAELSAEVSDVAARIAAANTQVPSDAGLVERLVASARSAVTVRPVGEVEGDAPEAVAARMEAAVERGDYARALSEYDALPPEAKEVAGDFAEKLRARQAADKVLEEALSRALNPA
ncbi:hypothetical protein [Chelativorans sp. Marseille-P2723]|uniref:COG4223 family protein n=1 Tax=Chelativorans sp. Marseille-P2723 TaxID=2709133 RepID=UPI00156E6DB4|nr:hypothetical protein [Chelativorans sp. Marseille-P2723]